jgi:hypothetical protein
VEWNLLRIKSSDQIQESDFASVRERKIENLYMPESASATLHCICWNVCGAKAVSREHMTLLSRLGFFGVAFLFFALPMLRAEKIDNRNFAIDTCYPTQNEIRLAEDRARNYWAKHAARFGSNPVYLAIKTSKIFPSEVQDLWQKLINSETTASFFSRGLDQQIYSSLELIGIMIFDTRTGRCVGNRGFISVDTPPLGRVARFNDYIARYIGFGNWG